MDQREEGAKAREQGGQAQKPAKPAEPPAAAPAGGQPATSLSEILLRAEKAYAAYKEAQSDVAQAYRESELEAERAYKE